MDLTAGSLFWPAQSRPMPRYPRLNDDATCEVAVVGGGVTGAMIAFRLTKMGVNLVLLDAQDVGEGSTAANTGLLLYELDQPLHMLAGQIGKDAAVRAYQVSYRALKSFPDLVSQLDDPCGLSGRHSIYLASAEKDIDGLLNECDARRSIGIDVGFLSRQQVRERFLFDKPGALESSFAMEVDPYRLTHALARGAQNGGARIFSHTKIARCEPDEHGITLHCNTGCRVRAAEVVFATGYQTLEGFHSPAARQRGTFVAVTQPLARVEGWEPRCMIWETARPYFYLRSTEDGRAMMGGGDIGGSEDIRQAELRARKMQMLVDRFSKLFPRAKIEVEFSWAGLFAETEDGLPFIGAHSHVPHAYLALCYGGNGTTFSLVAAEMIAKLYSGVEAPNLDLFRLDRGPQRT